MLQARLSTAPRPVSIYDNPSGAGHHHHYNGAWLNPRDQQRVSDVRDRPPPPSAAPSASRYMGGGSGSYHHPGHQHPPTAAYRRPRSRSRSPVRPSNYPPPASLSTVSIPAYDRDRHWRGGNHTVGGTAGLYPPPVAGSAELAAAYLRRVAANAASATAAGAASNFSASGSHMRRH
jgi:hypothetical protein